MTAMHHLITDNLDIWTGAVKAKSATGRGSNSKIELTGIKKLRELILELAVRGKLVPQDPNDEPASVLLKKIAAEKTQLIKEGKIKKQKALAEISEEEKPFKLPTGWMWSRLNSLVSILGDGLHGTPHYDDSGAYFFINGNNLSNGIIKIKPGTKKVNLEEYTKHRKDLNISTIFVSINGTLGNVAFYNSEPVMLGKSACYFNMIEHQSESKLFIKRVIESPYFKKYAIDQASGTTIKNLGLKAMNLLPIAVPPISEQKRIVVKVQQLMAICDHLEKQTEQSIEAHQTLVEVLLNTLTSSANATEFQQNWQRIAAHFDTLFTTEQSIKQLKQTILQLAVMGKLVPQDSNDEPASVLLEKIAKEKEKLIAEKKIKKQKPLPEISEDEKPFSLPSNWHWSQIAELSELSPRNNVPDNHQASFVPMPLISTNCDGSHQQEVRQWSEIKKGYTHFANGDIAIAKITPCFENSKAAIFSNLKNGIGAGTTELHVARIIGNLVNSRYVLLFLKTPHFLALGESQMTGSAGQKRIPKNTFSLSPIPLPPFLEQVRIVNKVDQLMTLCNQLKTNIQQNQTTKVNLAETLVKQGLN